MPELPEVEVTRRSFASRIAGARIIAAIPGKPLRWPLGCLPEALVGRRILGVRRRGKYLLVDLDQGLVLVHLGMSGSLSFAATQPPAGPHDHFDLVTTAGTLRLHDPRRFGAVVWAPSEGEGMAAKLLGGLGAEPLAEDFDAQAFAGALKRHHVAIKLLLLSGRIVVGVGNIYASEALFRAGIDPRVAADRVSRPRALKLAEAVREVLGEAVARGGTTLRDFRDANGDHGWFQLDARVYGRAGLACLTCGAPVRMIRQGQRSTFFCAHCQRR